jgi:hypothetical protein
MKNFLVVALALPLAACLVGADGVSPGDDDDDPGPGSNDNGRITQDTTFTGTVDIDVATTIDPGVTVTVMPGTTIQLGSSASLTVQGVLDIQGLPDGKVTIASSVAGQSHGGINIPSGELRMAYAVQSGGGIRLSGTGEASIVDSTLSNPGSPSSQGDFLVMSGGSLTMAFSEIGLATGDGTHCNFHFGGAGNTISVTKSTIRGVPYGLMFYGGTGAIFTENNWENPINVDTQPGVQGDFSGSYFQGGAPTPGPGANLVLANLAQAPIPDARPRP